MVRELGEETGLLPERLEAAKYLCSLVEYDGVDGITNWVEVYAVPGIRLDEIEILEGVGVVMVTHPEQLQRYHCSRLGQEVLELLRNL